MTACFILVSAALGTNAFENAFAEGVEAYETGAYAEAVDRFEQLVAENVVHPDVFYNLANSYYRLGELGPAIANYERARSLAPGDPKIEENLAMCVSATQRRMTRPLPSSLERSLLFWHYGVPASTTRFLAGLFWIAMWGLLGLRLLRNMKYLRRLAAVAGIASLAFATSAWVKAHPGMLVVANDKTVPVRYGTSGDDTIHFELFAGDRVRADRVERDWVRVETQDGQRGWAHLSQMTLVGPPYWPPGHTNQL